MFRQSRADSLCLRLHLINAPIHCTLPSDPQAIDPDLHTPVHVDRAVSGIIPLFAPLKRHTLSDNANPLEDG